MTRKRSTSKPWLSLGTTWGFMEGSANGDFAEIKEMVLLAHGSVERILRESHDAWTKHHEVSKGDIEAINHQLGLWQVEANAVLDMLIVIEELSEAPTLSQEEAKQLSLLSFSCGVRSIVLCMRVHEHEVAVGLAAKKSAKRATQQKCGLAQRNRPTDNEVQEVFASMLDKFGGGKTKAKAATAKAFRTSIRTLDKWLSTR